MHHKTGQASFKMVRQEPWSQNNIYNVILLLLFLLTYILEKLKSSKHNPWYIFKTKQSKEVPNCEKTLGSYMTN